MWPKPNVIWATSIRGTTKSDTGRMFCNTTSVWTVILESLLHQSKLTLVNYARRGRESLQRLLWSVNMEDSRDGIKWKDSDSKTWGKTTKFRKTLLSFSSYSSSLSPAHEFAAHQLINEHVKRWFQCPPCLHPYDSVLRAAPYCYCFWVFLPKRVSSVPRTVHTRIW